jgi:hypothetical protein
MSAQLKLQRVPETHLNYDEGVTSEKITTTASSTDACDTYQEANT